MARTKEMFKPYDEARVPDIMPFPSLARVATSKGEEAAVPALNEHQRSWILDVGIRHLDLASLSGGKAAGAVYDRVKNDAFEAKAFKHQVQPGDKAEEASLGALIAAWKLKYKKDTLETAADDGDGSDGEVDDGGREGLLRGYSKAGWRFAIQKVISNKRSADIRKRKEVGAVAAGPRTIKTPAAEAPALSKLLGIAAYTGRDKFRDDRHDAIYELAQTLPGENAGGKFRKAEGILWKAEDQASWEEAVTAEKDVDWAERQRLIPKSFKHMVETLHDSRKFRPFVATMMMAWLDEDGNLKCEWAEGVPDDICVGQRFKALNTQLVSTMADAMHAWSAKPLKEYLASRAGPKETPHPVFPVTADEADELAPKALLSMVTRFLEESYGAAFGAGEMPWPAIASKPDEYYDTAHFPQGFASTGIAALSKGDLYSLANTLARVAGAGTEGFFRKTASPFSRPSSPPPPQSPPPSRPSSPPPPPQSPPPRSRPSSPPPPQSPPPSRPSSPPPPGSPPPPPPLPQSRSPSPPPAKKTRGKRKAAEQLVPEDAEPSGRPARKRRTPAEAQAEREEEAAAAKTGRRRTSDRISSAGNNKGKAKTARR
ncbi:hypothetical protein B0H15DRAFT_955824 [Mycena belliarum]|uniref:Uncharacterized protein n=1 Tax=Mycena belliarum TaxID=1033014 RepID=A0AAD6TS96_9AGAR|nr:hypothetical protein B0H15DRAFT_955824 [Mycena belliae]